MDKLTGRIFELSDEVSIIERSGHDAPPCYGDIMFKGRDVGTYSDCEEGIYSVAWNDGETEGVLLDELLSLIEREAPRHAGPTPPATKPTNLERLERATDYLRAVVARMEYTAGESCPLCYCSTEWTEQYGTITSHEGDCAYPALAAFVLDADQNPPRPDPITVRVNLEGGLIDEVWSNHPDVEVEVGFFGDDYGDEPESAPVDRAKLPFEVSFYSAKTLEEVTK